MAQAVPVGTRADSLGDWLLGFSAVLGVVISVLWIVQQFRPKPPLYKQFAPLDHGHSDLVSRVELHEGLDKVRNELTQRLEEGARRDARTDEKLDLISSKISEGFSRVHARIDPISETVSATAKVMEHHLEDHRRSGRTYAQAPGRQD